MPEDSTQSTQTGQAPASGQPQAGIDPTAQAAAGTSQQSSSAAGTQASGTAGQASGGRSADEYERIIAELRKEQAGNRTKLKAFEDAQAAADAAKLSDLEKAQKQAADAAKAVEAYKQRVADYAVRLEASKLGIVDPELAALAIAGRLEFADDGTPSNATDLLKDLVKAKPYLIAQQAGTQTQGQSQTTRQPASSGGAANAGASARVGAFTRESIAKMTPSEYAANRTEIMQWLASTNGSGR